MTPRAALLLVCLPLSGCPASSPWGLVSTVAGEHRGSADGDGRAARFDNPTGIAVAPDGTIYVADTYNHRIRAIAPNHRVTTLAGGGPSGVKGGGAEDGPGATARFRFPRDLALADGRHLYVADTNNNRIRCVDLADPAHAVTTVAGSGPGRHDGPGAQARFLAPWGLACGRDGTLYVADTYNNMIRRVEMRDPAHAVTTLAGTGRGGEASGGYLDGPALEARFHGPRGLVVDGDVIYVADAANQAIRRVAGGQVATLGGTLTLEKRLAEPNPLIYPTGLVLDRHDPAHPTLYAVDSGVGTVYRIGAQGELTWLVGGAKDGAADGFWRGGQFHLPGGIACDPAGRLLVSDTGNHRIRAVI